MFQQIHSAAIFFSIQVRYAIDIQGVICTRIATGDLVFEGQHEHLLVRKAKAAKLWCILDYPISCLLVEVMPKVVFLDLGVAQIKVHFNLPNIKVHFNLDCICEDDQNVSLSSNYM